jgi:uncharacterized protein
MRYEPGVKLALVQSDVYQAFVDMAHEGNGDADQVIRPLRLIMPLYDEEIHFVTRADSPLRYIQDIRNHVISVGLIGSGTAQSSYTLYRLMFGESLPESNARHLSNEDALAQLIAGKIEVAVIIAGQPAKLFQDMNPELLHEIRLLKFDPHAPQSTRAQQVYFPATIRASSYPNWLTEDSPTLTVKAFLVTYDYGQRSTVANLDRFARSLCENFDTLQTSGHPKWKQVRLDLPALGKGWRYYSPMERTLRSCIAQRESGTTSTATAQPARAAAACTGERRLLLLCKP